MDIVISSILEQVLTGLSVALAAIIAAGICYLFGRLKNERLAGYGELLASYAEKAVKEVAQITGDEYKAANADGKFTEDEKAELKRHAMATLRAIAPDAVLKFMEKANSDLDALLSALIESAVKDSKEGDTQ